MKGRFSFLLVGLLIVILLSGLLPAAAAQAQASDPSRAKIVVANRGSGSISVIDANAGTLRETLALPPGENQPEPMYVVYTPARNRVWVGDRANDRIVAFDARSFSVESIVPVGAGVFHMWADPQNDQLWVVGDVDMTISVVDLKSETLQATVPIPADLQAAGGKPHDVILDPQRDLAFVTVNGVAGPSDFVVQYSTATFEELSRAAVGKDAHLSLARQNDRLYVPCQGSNIVVVLNRETMQTITDIDIPGAHGAGMARDGQVFYTTNLPGGGAQGLFAIDLATNTVIGTPTDTPYPVPHNIALTPDSRMLFLTHSGAAANKVTFYTASQDNPQPNLAGEVTVGLNPFGLSYVP